MREKTLLSILTALLGFAGPAVQIGNKIADLIMARQQAKTDVEKALIDQQVQELRAHQAVILAEASSPFTRVLNGTLRGLAAIGPIAYQLKVFLWDKTIGAFIGCSGSSGDLDTACHIFNTDRLVDPNLNWVMIAVIGFYFLTAKR